MAYDRNLNSLLAALRKFANRDGYIDGISFPVLKRESGLGLRSIPRLLDEAETLGLIVIHRHRGRGLTNRYEIKPTAKPAPKMGEE